MAKICTKCFKEKDISEFPPNKASKGGIHSTCRVCIREFNKILEREFEEYWKIHDAYEIGETKVCSKCGKEKDVKMFPKNNSKKSGLKAACKDCTSKVSKQWKKRNPEKRNASERKWSKKRRATNEKFRLLCAMRSRITKLLKKQGRPHKTYATTDYLSLQVENFVNIFGNRVSGYELDHKIPFRCFNLELEEHFKLSNWFKNCQWLLKDVNGNKSDQLYDFIFDDIELLKILIHIKTTGNFTDEELLKIEEKEKEHFKELVEVCLPLFYLN